jgi:hypothetical protein
MGREATCKCKWGREAGECKVLLETHELIVRGPIRHKVPIASLAKVRVQGDQLKFRTGDDDVELTLGAELAERWASKIAARPVTLATKLGISPTTNLCLIGEFETEELKTAVAKAATTSHRHPDLILARVTTPADLNHVLDVYGSYPANPPIWIVYPKGLNKPIGETEVRVTLRHEGFIDTKVASVSDKLTALRFLKRS